MNTVTQKIMHLRPTTPRCNPIDYFDWKKVNYSNKGGMTIVSRLHKENFTPVLLEYALSFTSPKDEFVKRLGVELATVRLTIKDEFYRSLPINVNNSHDNDELLMYIISDILMNVNYPRHVKKLLKNYFKRNY